jgi:putative flippase GtrA
MDLFFRIIKFGLTGLLGMAIDFGATWLCKEKIKINKYIANAIGFTLAVPIVIGERSLANFWS